MRRKAIILITVVVALAAQGLAATLATAADDTPMAKKAAIVADLEALVGEGGDKDLQKAIDAVNAGLAPEYWNEDGSALSEKGKKAFDKDEKAIKELEKVGGLDAFIQRLVDIDRALAEARMEAAPEGADLSKAEKELAKGAEELAKGKPDKAVERYGKAWKEAGKAKVDDGGDVGASGVVGDAPYGMGKYSVYEVVFVRADTVEWDEPVFMTVSGHNEPGSAGDTGKGNEGFIFSNEFGPADTFLSSSLWPTPDGGIMQLHVSCSDAFPDGVGAKSDPQPESRWRINTIHIIKYEDGTVVKECGLSGLDLPYTPPHTPPAAPPPGGPPATPPAGPPPVTPPHPVPPPH